MSKASSLSPRRSSSSTLRSVPPSSPPRMPSRLRCIDSSSKKSRRSSCARPWMNASEMRLPRPIHLTYLQKFKVSLIAFNDSRPSFVLSPIAFSFSLYLQYRHFNINILANISAFLIMKHQHVISWYQKQIDIVNISRLKLSEHQEN